ncbi:hypothetical protein [Phocaeicola sp.]
MNQLFKVNLHRRGRLNLPDNIRMVYLWMHSGGFNPPLRWTAMLFISIPEINVIYWTPYLLRSLTY